MAKNTDILMIIEGETSCVKTVTKLSHIDVIGFDSLTKEAMRGKQYDKVLLPLSMRESEGHIKVLQIIKPLVLIHDDFDIRIIYY
ncbi:hypothetical protein TCA2_4612 [Paenibacillus sp. TCA20]|uniref:Uncharacterized protein n=1 Tax=Paenibacillus urinalis TaxID=521520 RepID=A0ABY7XJS8_9BACL|nr:hypothetical protein [Paenibacillus urinalis]WDI05054.1 hypothetical protein PUW25_26150 [Paenibacillus urinalis]GAK42120.1 hypothetical protein TCA2_4612 [Paenibacillus sp. TCA20]